MRWPCSQPLLATLNGTTHKAVLINISASGARLKGLQGLAPGNRLILRHLNRTLMAEVRWTRAGLCGVRFAAPLKHDELTMIRQGVARSGTTSPHSHAQAHTLRELR